MKIHIYSFFVMAMTFSYGCALETFFDKNEYATVDAWQCALPDDARVVVDAFWQKHMDPFLRRNDLWLSDPEFNVKNVLYDVSNELPQKKISEIVFKLGSASCPIYKNLRRHLHDCGCAIIKADEKTIVFMIPGLQGYVCKMPGYIFSFLYAKRQHNIARVISAYKMAHYIDKHNIQDYVMVPRKFLYHLPGKPNDVCDENYIVFSEFIDGTEYSLHENISHEKIDALLALMFNFGLDDIYTDNLLIDAHGRFCFIDTEGFIGIEMEENIAAFIKNYRNVYNALSCSISAIADFWKDRDKNVGSLSNAKRLYQLKIGLRAVKAMKDFFPSQKEYVINRILHYKKIVKNEFFACTNNTYFLKENINRNFYL